MARQSKRVSSVRPCRRWVREIPLSEGFLQGTAPDVLGLSPGVFAGEELVEKKVAPGYP